MDKTVVITERNEQIITCLFHDYDLYEIQAEKPEESIVGNVYLGKVQSVVKNLNSAFIEILPGKICFMPIQKEELARALPNGKEHLVAGDSILVQVVRDTIKTKDAVVSMNISIAGKYSVVSLNNPIIGYSTKLTKKSKEKLSEWVTSHFSGEFGYVIRTNAEELDSKELLTEEIISLTKIANEIKQNASYRTIHSCLYHEVPSYVKKLRDLNLCDIDKIVTDNLDLYHNILNYLENEIPQRAKILKLYEDASYPLSKLYSIETKLQEALQAKVWLKSGGYLLIENTEAMTVIDVNTGKFTGKKSNEETYFLINKEAATEIARQLRLRNISGIIMVDFINMKNQENLKNLVNLLKEELSKDSVKCSFIDFTVLGLAEITRKRVFSPIKEQFFC